MCLGDKESIHVNNIVRLQRKILMRRPIAMSFLILSTALVAITFRVSMPYIKNDLLQTLLSFTGPFVSLIACFLLFHTPSTSSKWNSTNWGFFIGGSLFVLLQSFVIMTHYEAILSDGTAYWIYVNLPAYLLGIPICLVGALIGWITDIIINKKTRKRLTSGSTGPREAPLR